MFSTRPRPMLLHAIVAATVCACAVTSIHADVTRPVTIAVRLRIDASIDSRRITALLKDEAEGIWRPYGIQLDWADTDGAGPAAASLSLDATVERQFERPRLLEGPRVLGRVVMNPATSSWRPIRVSFDAIESVLAQRTTGRRSHAGIVPDRDLARALGRVLAHEIGHVLIGAPGHDRAGLMRATFNPEQLGEPDRRPFQLTCSSADQLRRRLAARIEYTKLSDQHDSAPLDSEGRRWTGREFRGEASCLAVQPAR